MIEVLDTSKSYANKELQAFIGKSVFVNPQELRNSHNSISPYFRCGRSVLEVSEKLRSGKLSYRDLPQIEIVVHEGKWYSQNNRRLYAFKHAQLTRVKATVVSPGKHFFQGLTTQSDGWHVNMNNHSCDICGRDFATRASLLQHQEVCKGPSAEAVCMYCRDRFVSKAAKCQHVKQCRSKPERPQCTGREITVCYEIPADVTGRVIGKGGTNIAKMTHQSGLLSMKIVRVDRENRESNDLQSVQMLGTAASIEQATGLLRDVISDARVWKDPRDSCQDFPCRYCEQVFLDSKSRHCHDAKCKHNPSNQPKQPQCHGLSIKVRSTSIAGKSFPLSADQISSFDEKVFLRMVKNKLKLKSNLSATELSGIPEPSMDQTLHSWLKEASCSANIYEVIVQTFVGGPGKTMFASEASERSASNGSDRPVLPYYGESENNVTAPSNTTSSWSVYAETASSGPKCFLPGSWCVKDDGAQVCVEDLKLGDLLQGPEGSARVSEVYPRPPNHRQIIEVTMASESGNVQLKVTGNHRVVLQNWGYKKAADLIIGDVVSTSAGDLQISQISTCSLLTSVIEVSFEADHSVYLQMDFASAVSVAVFGTQQPIPDDFARLVEFRLKGPICSDAPIEVWLRNMSFDAGNHFGLRFWASRPFAVWVPRENADLFWNAVKEILRGFSPGSRLRRQPYMSLQTLEVADNSIDTPDAITP